MPKSSKKAKRRIPSPDECTIPGRVPDSVLNKFVLNRSEPEADAIREYVEWQSPKEKVTYLEKVATEHLFDRKIEAWDVHTDGERYWVITEPTNLYSQEEWQDDAALEAHFATDHIQNALAKFPDLLAEDLDVRRYVLVA
jgi:hypothetical protein